MDNVQTAVEKLTLDDFMRLLDEEQPFELIDGEIVYMAPTKFQHNRVAAKLMMALSNHAADKGLGEVFFETTIVLADANLPNWVQGSRVPDVLFIKAERLAEYMATTPDWDDKPLLLIPDLVVEIVSPSDSFTDIDRKVEGYLHDGVQLVWIVDPKRKRINVITTSGQARLGEGDVLMGDKVIPGFEMPVGAIFE